MGTTETLNGLKDDAVISRYMSFASFASTLQTRKLFFNTVSQFEDRNEGAATVLDSLAKSYGPMLDIALNFSWPAASETPEERAAKDAKAAEFRADLEKPSTYATPFGPYVDHLGLKYEGVLHKLRNWLDVACWHKSFDESLAMWRIYGRSTEAVCITSTVGRLKEALRLPSDTRCCIAEVRYIDHVRDFFQTGSDFDAVLHKMHAYAFEQEVRAIVWNPSTKFTDDRKTFGRPIDVDLSTLISGIRLSPDSKPWLRELVESMLTDKGLSMTVEGSSLDRNHWAPRS